MGAVPAWEGTGECVVGVVLRPGGRAPLPAGLRPVPGPQLVVAARYATSPVGAYLELAVAQPARLGARVGMCSTTMIVDLLGARTAGRAGWGFPKEMGTLRWTEDGDDRALQWEERGVVVRGASRTRPFPGLLPYSSLQQRVDGPVWVTGRLRGRARLATTTVETPAGDPLGFLAGRHAGALFAEAQVTMRAAKPLPAPSRP